MDKPIDFVILWVDNQDKKWLKEKSACEKKYYQIDNRESRYRDWENLKYWFRGVEKYANWVNKIHFITCGHVPEWLNLDHPKLHIVKHSDYMPKDALPTFNSNAIELGIHQIKDLQEQFVLFNDDMFIIRPTKKSDFFKNGIPKNSFALLPVIPFSNYHFYKTLANNVEVINQHFSFRQCVSKNLLRYLSFTQGKYLLRTIPFLFYKNFVGFANYHMPISYLKATFEEVWSKESSLLNQTVHSRFRNNEQNVSHWLMNYWQFASGNFVPKCYKSGMQYSVDNPKLYSSIQHQKYKMICISEVEELSNFLEIKNSIIDSFEKILPEKSSFEK